MLKKQSLTETTLNNGAWQSTTVIFQGVIQIIVIAIMARLLSPSDFGLIAIANLVIGFAAMFTRFGLSKAIVQKKNLTEVDIRVAFTVSLAMAMLLTALLYIFAPIIARFFRNPEAIPIIQALSISFVFSNLGITSKALLTRKLAFKKLFWVATWTYTFGYALVGIVLILKGYGVWALVYASLATKLVESAVLLILQPHPKRPSFQRKELEELIHFGGGVTLSALFKYIGNNGDYFVIGRWLGPMALGIYQQAFNILVIFARYLGNVLESVLFATVSLIQDEQERLTRAYTRSLSLINLILLPLSIVMIILAPEIIIVYLGEQWTEAIMPMQILLVGLTFRSQSRISDAFAHAVGEVYQPALRKGIFAAIIIMGSLIGQFWGIIGVSIAVTFAMILDCILVVELGLRLTKIPYREYAKSMLPGIYMSGLILLMGLPFINLLRTLFNSSFWILFISIFVIGGTINIFIVVIPVVLGASGLWFTNAVVGMLPQAWATKFRSSWWGRRVLLYK